MKKICLIILLLISFGCTISQKHLPKAKNKKTTKNYISFESRWERGSKI